MADLETLELRVAALELERRVAALEDKIGDADVKAIRRDMRRALELTDAALELGEKTHKRVVENELTANANAQAVEKAFAEVNGRLDRMGTEIGSVNERLGRMETAQTALIKNLPTMIAETMREVLKEGGV
jgi:hypothetical protein